MNKDILEGNWKQIKGRIKARWGRLSDDDLEVVEGNFDLLSGKLQEAYGYSKDEADKELGYFQVG